MEIAKNTTLNLLTEIAKFADIERVNKAFKFHFDVTVDLGNYSKINSNYKKLYETSPGPESIDKILNYFLKNSTSDEIWLKLIRKELEKIVSQNCYGKFYEICQKRWPDLHLSQTFENADELIISSLLLGNNLPTLYADMTVINGTCSEGSKERIKRWELVANIILLWSKLFTAHNDIICDYASCLTGNYGGKIGANIVHMNYEQLVDFEKILRHIIKNQVE